MLFFELLVLFFQEMLFSFRGGKGFLMLFFELLVLFFQEMLFAFRGGKGFLMLFFKGDQMLVQLVIFFSLRIQLPHDLNQHFIACIRQSSIIIKENIACVKEVLGSFHIYPQLILVEADFFQRFHHSLRLHLLAVRRAFSGITDFFQQIFHLCLVIDWEERLSQQQSCAKGVEPCADQGVAQVYSFYERKDIAGIFRNLYTLF